MPFRPELKVPSKLKGLFGSSGKRNKVQGYDAVECQTKVTPSLSLDAPQSHSFNPGSSQKSLSVVTRSSPPWQTWTFDQDFVRHVYDWNESHGDSMPDRIISGICTSIDQHKDLFELIPDGPIPFRGFVKALAHLILLGVTIVEAKDMALRFTQDILLWVERLACTFGDSGSGRFLSQTWENLAEIRKIIEDTCAWAHRMLNCGLGERASVDNQILAFQKQFTHATERFEVLSGITLARGQDILIRGQDKLVQMVQKIQPPPTIPDATYEFQKKHPCDDGTRKEILEDIMEWVDDITDTARCFFWLSGDPGVGKSAITASIAKACKRRRVLWAQFFINRNDARTVDPRLFFPSIAQQMSRSSRAVEHAVQDTLKDQPDLMNEDISVEQAKGLFVNTIWVASKANPSSPVVIVIDALDETDFKRLADTAEIFSQVIMGLPRNVKVFISSRAEDIIRDFFAPQLTSARVRHMHLSAKDSIPEVTTFLKRKVATIMKKYHIDLSEWGEERMQKLCTQASGLFIWAVTAIEYIQAEIEDSGKECLGVVLDELNTNGMEDINRLYLAILNRTYRRKTDLWAFQRFRRIMGAILVQQSPLCVADLESLLSLRNPRNNEPADIEHFVRRLRTVLVAGAGEINSQTFPRVHRSFSDFVTSAGAKEFRVDTIDADGELAIRCIRQLDRMWKRERSKQRKIEMPGQIPYAISHWSSHLTRVVGAKMEEADDDSISILDAENIVSDPKKSTGAPIAIEKRSHARHNLYCIAVSQDGTRVAFAQGPSIRLRDVHTGDDIVAPILGHEDVNFVAFSPDGKHIVSASDDFTICVWNSDTGDMTLGPLQGHTDEVLSAVYSPDGKRIVSASTDTTICIWNSDTGDMVLGPLRGHTDEVWSTVFSPNGQLLVSASYDNTICIWNSNTGNMVLGPLEGHTNGVLFAVFSADGQHIVSCSTDGMILVWDSLTGEQMSVPSEGDTDVKLSFTNSETAPYIVTPPQGNIPLQGTSTYYFHLDNAVAVGGVVNSSVDTWLYANCDLKFIMGRYLGQLILRLMWSKS